ncbi:MAG: hypothetical protein ACI87W_002452 [Halieaceae bacterium]
MNPTQNYPIGIPGVAWGEAEKAAWLSGQSEQRRYGEEVEPKIEALGGTFQTEQYGKIAYAARQYTLYALISQQWNPALPNILITGGVHGYETSGVMGALRFLESAWEEYAAAFNFLVLPCVSPWAFETINRWNPLAVDPNRSFLPNSKAREAAAVMAYLRRRSLTFLAHFDLHETTDTDNSEFGPALAARDAKPLDRWDIPDGFYTVADTARPAFEFQTAIIQSVAKVTHIAPPTDGRIIGEALQQPGVICYDGGKLGLCMGLTDARYVTTTEVYPDSPRVTGEECVVAQVAAIRGGLDYLMAVGVQ